MKKSLLLILIFLIVTGIQSMSALSRDYIVTTSQAPVWGMQSETTPVIGWLVEGDVPESEVDDNDPQWIYIKQGNIAGWMHVLSLRHIQSEESDDQKWIDESFKNHLRDLGVDTSVIERVGEPAEPKSSDTTVGERANTLPVDNYMSVTGGKGSRGLEAEYVYVVTKDVECPVNEAYRASGNMITLARDAQKFEAGYWFPASAEVSGGVMLMDGGKGFDMPAGAFHLLTEQEYEDYMGGILYLKYNPELGTLKSWLETHDIAQSGGWSIKLPELKKTVLDLWPLAIPILLLLVVVWISSIASIDILVAGWIWIALIMIELALGWHYISMPANRFDDFGGLAWVPIAICVLVSLAIVTYTGYLIVIRTISVYKVEPKLKHALAGLGIGVAICIVVDLMMIYALGVPKNDVSLGVAGLVSIVVGLLGWMCYRLMSQNPNVAVALPSILLISIVSLIAALTIIASLSFILVFIVVWMYFSGYFNKGVKIPGLVSSEQATCGKCAKYGTASCPRSNVGPSDSACDDFE